MQLLALNREGKLLLAASAESQVDYICPECESTLRLRKGEERLPHFYHPKRPKNCRQEGKSLEHLHTQLFLLKRYPGGEIEKRFPEIGRVADVALESEKLIFEIQVSPISLFELKARTRNYTELGYKVIWVFHEKSFDPTYPSSISRYFRLFSNIDKNGSGTVYEVRPPPQKAKRRVYRFVDQLIELISK